VAERYSGRVPYLPEFFAKAAEFLGMSKTSTLLDLGCGTGSMAVGFAPYCQSVLAVDRSESMLAHRREAPANVRFLQADVNAEATTLPVRADVVTIGMAVHFFDKHKLIALLDAVSTPSAAVFVCGTTISQETPWFPKYLKMRARYHTLSEGLDIYGHARFAATRWLRQRFLRVTAKKPFGMRDLMNHALSYPNLSEAILKDKDNFERDLENLLAPYVKSPDGVIAEFVSWGLEYRRSV
jgi:ubiquinone/menaquinone biosynthesis C-methylase UbiE